MLPPPGRLLGVDHGHVRIGLAVCDALGLVARPLLVWRRRSRAEDFARFREIIAAQRLVGAVVGIPGGDASGPPPRCGQHAHLGGAIRRGLRVASAALGRDLDERRGGRARPRRGPLPTRTAG